MFSNAKAAAFPSSYTVLAPKTRSYHSFERCGSSTNRVIAPTFLIELPSPLPLVTGCLAAG